VFDFALIPFHVSHPRNQKIKGLQRCRPFVFWGVTICAHNFYVPGTKASESVRIRRQVIGGKVRVAPR